MYGTIMRARVKPERRQEFERYMLQDAVPGGDTGFVGIQVGWEDKDPNRLVGVVVFKDKESYQRNSERPDTASNYEKMQEFFDGGVEWIDVNWAQYVGAGSAQGTAAGA